MLALAGCGVAPVATQTPAGSPAASPAAVSSPLPSPDIAGLIETLAESGVAVHEDESAETPVREVGGPQVFAVTRWQLENMAAEAVVGTGMTGAELDAAIEMPEGTPPFSYLLAAWIDVAETAGSSQISELMGDRDWTHAPAYVYPTLALVLFGADVAQAAATEEPAARKDLAARTQREAFASVVGMAPVAQLDRPCSLVTKFVDQALNTLFNALKVDPATFGSGIPGLLGAFLAGIWNAAITLAQDVIQAAIKELTAEVVAAIRSAVAVAMTISVITSYLKPWTVRVEPAPSAIHLSVEGGEQVRGSFTLVADNRVDQWPPAVRDCAAAVGVTPPSLTAAGAPVRWTVQFGSELIMPDGAAPYPSTLDAQKRAVLNYSAASEPADWHASGPLVTSSVRVSGEVERKEVTELLQMAEQAVFKSIPGGEAVQRVVEAVLAPQVKALLSEARARLPALLKATGATTLEVSRHSSPEHSPAPSGGSNPVWVHLDRPAAEGVEPLRAIELVGCDGPWGHWNGAFRVAGLSSLLPIVEIPASFDVPGSGEQTVHLLTETVMVPLPLGDPEPVYADVDIRISGDGKTMTLTGRPGIDNIFEPEDGAASISLPIEPAPTGACR